MSWYLSKLPLWDSLWQLLGTSSVLSYRLSVSIRLLASPFQNRPPSWEFPWSSYEPGCQLPTPHHFPPPHPHTHTTELVLELEDHQRDTKWFLLCPFPHYLSILSLRERIITENLLFTKVLDGVGANFMVEGKIPSLMLLVPTRYWVGQNQKQMVVSSLLAQPCLFHCFTCRSPLTPMWNSGSWGLQVRVTVRRRLARLSLQHRCSVICRIHRAACNE